MNDPLQKVADWAKENPKIAIPAAVIGGVGVLFLISKSSGGLSSGSPDGISNNPPLDQQAEIPGSDNGLSSAVADLQNQLIQQQANEEASRQGILGQLEAFAASVQAALTGQQAQTQAALDSLAGQSQAAIDQLYAQQAGYGDNGLGQLLAQIPAFLGQQQQYSTFEPVGFQDIISQPVTKLTAINPAKYADPLRASALRATTDAFRNLGKLSGVSVPAGAKPSAAVVTSFRQSTVQSLPVTIQQFAAKNLAGFAAQTSKGNVKPFGK